MQHRDRIIFNLNNTFVIDFPPFREQLTLILNNPER